MPPAPGCCGFMIRRPRAAARPQKLTQSTRENETRRWNFIFGSPVGSWRRSALRFSDAREEVKLRDGTSPAALQRLMQIDYLAPSMTQSADHALGDDVSDLLRGEGLFAGILLGGH